MQKAKTTAYQTSTLAAFLILLSTYFCRTAVLHVS